MGNPTIQNSEAFVKRPGHLLGPDFFAQPTLRVAPDLIGCLLRYRSALVRIVEVEAYTDDESSHGFRRTARSAIMHDSFGHIYVYRSYGVHVCLNFTTDRKHCGAVLIRSAEPLEGLGSMRRRRGDVETQKLLSGPGNLSRALGITLDLNESMIGDKIEVIAGAPYSVVCTPRIGISKARNHLWRFFDPDSPSISGTKALNATAKPHSLTGKSKISE
ncbi:MAG: DNA-3-methyladenine glycosylase [bacterium]|nr:DNA-3-methyladenine glycosylase [bacterium]